MEFQVTKYKRGYVVEVRKYKWTLFGIKKYWTHYISVSGIESMPWYFKTREVAISELLLKIKFDII